MRKKVLLMGKSKAGKTSMRTIIFSNYMARNTRRLASTLYVEQSHVRFLGSLTLNIYDCGGQEDFVNNYLNNRESEVFKDVEVLVYLFDVTSTTLKEDMEVYGKCLEAVQNRSSNAYIFCLIHKMDLIQPDLRENLIATLTAELCRVSYPSQCECIGTSIWDETLFKAWSEIVHRLVPNIQDLEDKLNLLLTTTNSDEIILFEKATYLVIAHAQKNKFLDLNRFEKISNIVKQYKLSCNKMQANLKSFEIQSNSHYLFADQFTENMKILVVVPNSVMRPEMCRLTIKQAQKYFERLDRPEDRRLFIT